MKYYRVNLLIRSDYPTRSVLRCVSLEYGDRTMRWVQPAFEPTPE